MYFTIAASMTIQLSRSLGGVGSLGGVTSCLVRAWLTLELHGAAWVLCMYNRFLTESVVRKKKVRPGSEPSILGVASFYADR